MVLLRPPAAPSCLRAAALGLGSAHGTRPRPLRGDAPPAPRGRRLRGPGLRRVRPASAVPAAANRRAGRRHPPPACAFAAAPAVLSPGGRRKHACVGGRVARPGARPARRSPPRGPAALRGRPCVLAAVVGGAVEAPPLGCTSGLRWLLRTVREGEIRRFPGAGGGQGPAGAWTRGLLRSGQRDRGRPAACDSRRRPAPLSRGAKCAEALGQRQRGERGEYRGSRRSLGLRRAAAGAGSQPAAVWHVRLKQQTQHLAV